jgi:hypothetical protein
VLDTESGYFKDFWIPAPAPDTDPGFAGMTILGLFTSLPLLNGALKKSNVRGR